MKSLMLEMATFICNQEFLEVWTRGVVVAEGSTITSWLLCPNICIFMFFNNLTAQN
jgi:hypothetical protein